MTAIERLKEVSSFLKSKGIEDYAKEAEALVTGALNISKSALYSSDIELSEENANLLQSFALRRANGEPVHYIIGHVEFCGVVLLNKLTPEVAFYSQ